MKSTLNTVIDFLNYRPDSPAVYIARQIGVSVVEVYEALVWLECRVMAKPVHKGEGYVWRLV